MRVGISDPNGCKYLSIYVCISYPNGCKYRFEKRALDDDVANTISGVIGCNLNIILVMCATSTSACHLTKYKRAFSTVDNSTDSSAAVRKVYVDDVDSKLQLRSESSWKFLFLQRTRSLTLQVTFYITPLLRARTQVSACHPQERHLARFWASYGHR